MSASQFCRAERAVNRRVSAANTRSHFPQSRLVMNFRTAKRSPASCDNFVRNRRVFREIDHQNRVSGPRRTSGGRANNLSAFPLEDDTDCIPVALQRLCGKGHSSEGDVPCRQLRTPPAGNVWTYSSLAGPPIAGAGRMVPVKRRVLVHDGAGVEDTVRVLVNIQPSVRHLTMNTWTLAIALAGVLWISSAAAAESRGNSYPVIATGAQRQAIKSTHILHRPSRPGHFYGNTVRRRNHRAASVPTRRRR